MVTHRAQVDAAGNPMRDSNVRFIKAEHAGVFAMEKRAEWGAEVPDDVGPAFLNVRPCVDTPSMQEVFSNHSKGGVLGFRS